MNLQLLCALPLILVSVTQRSFRSFSKPSPLRGEWKTVFETLLFFPIVWADEELGPDSLMLALNSVVFKLPKSPGAGILLFVVSGTWNKFTQESLDIPANKPVGFLELDEANIGFYHEQVAGRLRGLLKENGKNPQSNRQDTKILTDSSKKKSTNSVLIVKNVRLNACPTL